MLTVRDGFYDEMLDEGGEPRPTRTRFVEALAALGPESLAGAGRRRDAIFMRQGITFDAAGWAGTNPTDRCATAPSRWTS